MKKAKPVTVKKIPEDHETYAILRELVDAYHVHLAEAKIALAFRYGWSPDQDGYLKLGQTKKGSDLDRSLHGYDFVILLNYEVWEEITDDAVKRYIVDHELCHCQVATDSNGQPRKDELGRTMYRLRKHDVEEFLETMERHGLLTHRLQCFAKAVLEAKNSPLFVRGESNKREAG
ncbi:MAG: hypothetical protein KatS3mg105_3273 [Gemmatales bacterium]|nr:MAG: hypothetical protein KatS3mg105_3273 [Gemmatales bacterium]